MTDYDWYKIKKVCTTVIVGFITALIVSFFSGYIITCIHQIKYLWLLPIILLLLGCFYMAIFKEYPRFEWDDQEQREKKIKDENKRLKRTIEIYKKTHNIRVL